MEVRLTYEPLDFSAPVAKERSKPFRICDCWYNRNELTASGLDREAHNAIANYYNKMEVSK